MTIDGSGPARPDPADSRPVEGDGRELVQPEVMDGAPPDAEADGEQVTRPAKLIRIASMAHTMLDEVRLAPFDDAGRRRLREIHQRSVEEVKGILSPDLRDELDNVVLPFTSDTPSESELRLAQAQLVGWLEGLFHGIQATLFTQHVMAQAQFEEMRRRALGAAPGAGGISSPAPGQYL